MTPAQRDQAEFDRRPFKERKAALNLAQMAQCNAGLSTDRVANLIDTLTVCPIPRPYSVLVTPGILTPEQAEAPTEVEVLLTVAEKTEGASAPVSDQEKKDLEALIALARRRLGGGAGS